MRIRFDNQNLKFNMGNTTFHVSNIVYECLTHPIPKHSHSKNSFEIHFISKGRGSAVINGVSYPILPNTLFVTGPFIAHEQTSQADNPMYEYCIYLETEQTPFSDIRMEEIDFATAFSRTGFFIGSDRYGIISLFEQLFFELQNDLPGRTIFAETLCKQILVQVVRNDESKKETGLLPVRMPSNLSGLMDHKHLIIEECFLFEYKTITLETLALRLGLSTRQVERLLKNQYSTTFAEKKKEARMSAATVLLQDRSKKISDISEQLGYSSVEHFSAAFKRFFMMTPTKYRKILNPNEIHSPD